MRILVASPPFVKGFCRSQRWPVVNRARALRYPDWLAYGAAVLEKAGHEVSFIDFIAFEFDLETMGRIVRELNPQLVVLDVTTPSIFNDIRCARICKQAAGCLVAFVGTHCSALPEETLEAGAGAVDFVLRGEYDYTLRDLAELLGGGENKDFSSVLGLSWRREEEIINNPARPLIENLDELPVPTWGHLDLKRYVNNIYDFPYLDMISGRGCPYRCTFCQWPQLMQGRKYRFRSAESVVDEMAYLFKTYPIREIFFEDDTLTANRPRLARICEEILRRGLKLKWSCNSRCDVDDLELLTLMKRSGCRMLLVGVESGSQEILNNVKKGIKLETMQRFARLAKQAGLSIHACYVIGLPGETKNTIEQTKRFIKEMSPDTIQVAGMMPMVGTEMFEWAREKGYLKAGQWTDYVSREGEQIPVMEYPHLSQRELNRAVDEILKDFYFDWKKIYNLTVRCSSLTEFYAKMRGAFYLARYALSEEKTVSDSLSSR